MVIVYRKLVLNMGYKDFLCPNMNNHYISFEKDKKYVCKD